MPFSHWYSLSLYLSPPFFIKAIQENDYEIVHVSLFYSILDYDCPRRDDRFVHISRICSIKVYNYCKYCKICVYVMTH